MNPHKETKKETVVRPLPGKLNRKDGDRKDSGDQVYLTECTCRSSCWIAGFRRSSRPSATASLPEEGSTKDAAAILVPCQHQLGRKCVTVTRSHKIVSIFFREASVRGQQHHFRQTWRETSFYFLIVVFTTFLVGYTKVTHRPREPFRLAGFELAS